MSKLTQETKAALAIVAQEQWLLLQQRAGYRAPAIEGLKLLSNLLRTHSGTGTTVVVAKFLGSVFYGYDFNVSHLRRLDLRWKDACIAVLQYAAVMDEEFGDLDVFDESEFRRWMKINDAY